MVVDESAAADPLGKEQNLERPEVQEPIDFTGGYVDDDDDLDDWASDSDVTGNTGNTRERMLLIGGVVALIAVFVVFSWWFLYTPQTDGVTVTPLPEAELGGGLSPAAQIEVEPAIEPEPVEEAVVDAVADPLEPAPVPAAQREPDPAPRPDPVPARPKPRPVPQPDPVPAPDPKPAPEPSPKKNKLSGLVDQGWSMVDTDPAMAAGYFQQALSISSTDAEANYGFGYAKMLQKDMTSARTFMCKAVAGGDASLKQEVSSVLRNKKLSCN
jgi:hypothetical protein